MWIDSTFSFLQILRLFLHPRPEKSINLINSHSPAFQYYPFPEPIHQFQSEHTPEYRSSGNQGIYPIPHPTVKRKFKESKTTVERLILYPPKAQFYSRPQLDLHLSLETQPRINPPPQPPQKSNPDISLQEAMQFQTFTLIAILATAIALPLPDMMGHFSFKRQVPADLSGAVSGAVSGVTGAVVGGVFGTLGAIDGSIASVGAVAPIPI